MTSRTVLLGWCSAIVAAWLVVGALLAAILLHISFEIPLWLDNASTAILHYMDPNYSPDAWDVETMTRMLLCALAYLMAAFVLSCAGVITWRRYIRRRFTG
ncbi:hypothetical protein [Paraburkholderia sp. J67]|uniref:hypothetical protein n=1 Tax=Paraburkholderia sp. J67 TaxID=2805435 RepID=UPI002ABDAC66|nr:hypothetical protein [Paraburkholderia sp. J67]